MNLRNRILTSNFNAVNWLMQPADYLGGSLADTYDKKLEHLTASKAAQKAIDATATSAKWLRQNKRAVGLGLGGLGLATLGGIGYGGYKAWDYYINPKNAAQRALDNKPWTDFLSGKPREGFEYHTDDTSMMTKGERETYYDGLRRYNDYIKRKGNNNV